MAGRIAVRGLPEIRHSRRLRAVAAGLFALCLSLFSMSSGAKPLPPVTVLWQLDSTRQADGVYGLTLTVGAHADFAEVEVAVSLPGGFRLSDGPAAWHGALAAGEEAVFSYTVLASHPGVVKAVVSGRTASNVHFARKAILHVPERPAIRPHAAPEPPSATGGVRELPSN